MAQHDAALAPKRGEEPRVEETDSQDAQILRHLGYKPVLHRTYNLFHNFAVTFAALYFIGGVRVTFSTGIAAGGNLAYWTSFIVTCVFTFITAAVIAETCSSLPLAGSIYLWAAEAGGPRFGRLFGQHPGRGQLHALARYFRWVFYASSFTVVLDFVMNLIWLPIGTANTYGFRSTHDAFMTTYNGTGAPAGWNWCLSYLATAGILIGFDASGHVAEETRNASVSAARGIFWSTVVSGLGGFVVVILFLFCVPDADTLFSFGGAQPFVPLYAAVLGRGGHIAMNIVCVTALWFNTAIAIIAASRLVFAVARDGVLPFSSWVARVDPSTGQPHNAVLVVWGVASLVTCSILPSAVAFTSLVSAAGVPSAAAYGLICLGRLTLTPTTWPKPRWSLGRWSRPSRMSGLYLRTR
ncbi:putative amino acid [Diplodia seriata]|uniref:Putative amino acid n=1 Tax=Diplodia seriata TaxID=420778 RepID=A0A0G2DXU5_9PEZI|nr:putative amino acid [Diplodia seriata]